jgi:hypothetical protein
MDELIAKLRGYNAVLVTGPQRSGTTIGARILAHELGYEYVDEMQFGIHNHNRAQEFMKKGRVVLHAPGLCHVADRFPVTLNYAVVVMRRPIHEIYASEQRIGWRTENGGVNLRVEQDKYAERFGIYGENIAAIKYFCWQEFQAHLCNSFYLDYDALKTHPMFVEVGARKDFAPRQYEVNHAG